MKIQWISDRLRTRRAANASQQIRGGRLTTPNIPPALKKWIAGLQSEYVACPHFPSSAAVNQQGHAVLEEILSSQSQLIQPNRFGGKDVFDVGTGRGFRYDGDGNMMGFPEP